MISCIKFQLAHQGKHDRSTIRNRDFMQTPTQIENRQNIQRRIMIVLMIAQIIGTIGVGVAPSIGILLAEEVMHNEAWAGLARTTSTLGAAMFGLSLGSFAAQRGRRLALSGGWMLAGLGAGLLVPAAQYELAIPLFVGLFLIGAGSAVSLQSRFAATDLAEPQQKARSLALVVWVGTLGSVLGPNLGAPGDIIGDATGLSVFASAFLIAAVCLILASIVVFFWLRPDPLLLLQKSDITVHTAKPTTMKARLQQVFAELQVNERARIAVIAIVIAQVVMAAIMTMTPVHIRHHGGSINIIGITISLHVAGMFALAPLVGLITDRLGHRITISIGIGIFFASLVVGMLRPEDMSWVVVALILLGLGWSFVNVAGSALFATVVSQDRRASAQGGVDALSNLGAAIAAFAAGPLLVVTSFAFLCGVAMIILLPLAFLMATRSLTPQATPVVVGD